jgi:hypothetical protein
MATRKTEAAKLGMSHQRSAKQVIRREHSTQKYAAGQKSAGGGGGGSLESPHWSSSHG